MSIKKWEQFNKLFESKYSDIELIDTDILLDVLQELTIDHDVEVYINKLLSYGDYRDGPRQSIGTGYVNMGIGKTDSFGVYSVKFVLTNDSVGFEKVTDTCKKAIRYYNEDRPNKISAFYHNWDYIKTDRVDNGIITYIEIYFTRNELYKYVLTQFHKVYELL